MAPDRESARIQAFKLVIDVQAAVPGAAEAIDRLLDDAVSKGWPEVIRAGIFAAAVAAVALDYEHGLPAIERFLAHAESVGDYAMVALALAMRCSLDTTGAHQSAALDTDADLARATVLLESGHGDELERITAHNECAQAYGDRWLWELADEQYAAGLSLAPSEPPPWLPFVLPAIVYNQAEMQVDWACAQHQLGDEEGVADRWRTWEAVMAIAAAIEMPDLWLIERSRLPPWRHLRSRHRRRGAISAGRAVTRRTRSSLAARPPPACRRAERQSGGAARRGGRGGRKGTYEHRSTWLTGHLRPCALGGRRARGT